MAVLVAAAVRRMVVPVASAVCEAESTVTVTVTTEGLGLADLTAAAVADEAGATVAMVELVSSSQASSPSVDMVVLSSPLSSSQSSSAAVAVEAAADTVVAAAVEAGADAVVAAAVVAGEVGMGMALAEAAVAPLPSTPPSTPTAVKREAASAGLSQLRVVPALSTSGSAKHLRGVVHGVRTHFPDTHCANESLTQAMSPTIYVDCD